MRTLLLFAASATALSIAGCGPPKKSSPAAELSTEGGQPIVDLALDVTVTTAPGGAAALDKYLGSPSPLHLGTVATLQETNGQVIRLIDNVRSGPNVSKDARGAYQIVFHYTPEFGGAMSGHRISELANVSSVGTRLGDVLAALGVRDGTASVTRLALTVNGRRPIKGLVDAPIRATGAPFQTIDVRALFSPIAAGQAT